MSWPQFLNGFVEESPSGCWFWIGVRALSGEEEVLMFSEDPRHEEEEPLTKEQEDLDAQAEAQAADAVNSAPTIPGKMFPLTDPKGLADAIDRLSEAALALKNSHAALRREVERIADEVTHLLMNGLDPAEKREACRERSPMTLNAPLVDRPISKRRIVLFLGTQADNNKDRNLKGSVGQSTGKGPRERQTHK